MPQQVWHIKEPLLLKAASAKHRSKFAALSLVMVTAARKLKNPCVAKNKQTRKDSLENLKPYNFRSSNSHMLPHSSTWYTVTKRNRN
jgi:hypothetical protein